MRIVVVRIVLITIGAKVVLPVILEIMVMCNTNNTCNPNLDLNSDYDGDKENDKSRTRMILLNMGMRTQSFSYL